MKISKHLLLLTVVSSALLAFADAKPKLTLDEFFNAVDYPAVAISPDGNSVVIVVERADWDQKIFRTDLWLYREGAMGGASIEPTPIQLTQSGHDTDPKWSPDGRWIAFLSERKTSSEKDSDSGEEKGKDKNKNKDKSAKGEVSQIFVISPTGGEAIPLTQGEEEVHTFTWSADSRTIYFATRNPWTKAQKDEYKKQWKDVVQYRTAERGDTIFALDVSAALARHATQGTKEESDTEKESDATSGARAIATSPLRVENLVTSPDGSKLAFTTNAINQRQEKVEDVEICTLDLTSVGAGDSPAQGTANKPAAQPRQLTHNQAYEERLHWANDNRHIFFTVEDGAVTGPYKDFQTHLFWVDSEKPDSEKPDSEKPDSETSAVEQWSKDFIGPVESYGVYGNGVVATARLGTEVQMYVGAKPSGSLQKFDGWDGTYEHLSTGLRSLRVAFVYSSLTRPAEVYLAEGPNLLQSAHPITSFNKLFTERDLPQGKPYRWKAGDGVTIEGMLIYPPGQLEAKHLPMFIYIHGGPDDADGNQFGADWYRWGALAATNGWLVFEPNYRGSTGYGDKFLMQLVPALFSRPGKDILAGADALVKEGIADPDRLTIGGYSYGGYLTNWLITQTTRFKAAVSGAGGVENVAGWGNDDTTFDDSYFFGGRPWEAPRRYNDEAAIFHLDKVRTPTHIVTGADDIRVPPLEQYLLEHALYSLGVPNKLLVFPGEGHSLAKNPWHGKIKVREELKWLQKYGGVPAAN